jgi:Flp pilus assembly protein CpaB
MTDVATAQWSKGTPDPSLGRERQTVRRQSALPTGRAVVGGFLVALSAIGIFSAYLRAEAGPSTSYVVARRDIPVGTRLTSADITLMVMELPDVVANAGAFRNRASLFGATTLGPVRRGELVQAGDVAKTGSGADELEISFAIDSSRALAGSLRPGERIDVLATFGSGGDTYTVAIVRNARVLEARSGAGRITAGDRDVLRLAVGSAQDALALTHAINAGEVTVVRTTGSRVDGMVGQTYRAPSSSDSSAPDPGDG